MTDEPHDAAAAPASNDLTERTPAGLLPPFKVVSARPFGDPRLSFKAQGVYGFLATRAPGWDIVPKALQRFAKDGRDSSYGGFGELVDAGLVETRQGRQRDGTFGQPEYRLVRPELEPWTFGALADDAAPAEEPQPHTENPDTVNPDTVNPDTDSPGSGSPGPGNPSQLREGVNGGREGNSENEGTEPGSTAPAERRGAPGSSTREGGTESPSGLPWSRWEADARELARTRGNLAAFVVRVVREAGVEPVAGFSFAEAGKLALAVGARAGTGHVPKPGDIQFMEDRAAWIVRAVKGLAEAGKGAETVPAIWQTVNATRGADTFGKARRYPDPAAVRRGED